MAKRVNGWISSRTGEIFKWEGEALADEKKGSEPDTRGKFVQKLWDKEWDKGEAINFVDSLISFGIRQANREVADRISKMIIGSD